MSEDITQGLDEIFRSNYVSGKSKFSYRQQNPTEYARVDAYLKGGAAPSPWPTTLMGSGLAKVERGRRALTAPTPDPEPEPSPGIATPQLPGQNYAIPSGAVSVSTLAELEAALAGAAMAVVLEDGVYAKTSPINLRGKSLYARHCGLAVIKTGVNLAGGHLHGVYVSVSAVGQLADNGGAVSTWTPHAGLHDVVIDGGNVAAFGLAGYAPRGLVVERVRVLNVTSDGLRISDNQGDSTAVIERVCDVYVDGARGADIPPGTGESGVWIGHPVTEPVERIEIHRAGWMGLWAGNACQDVTVSDLRIADIGPRLDVGIYCEHKTTRLTVRNFEITSGHGVTFEWYGESGTPSTTTCTFEDGVITDTGAAGCGIGFYFDERSATGVVTLRRITFEGQRWCAVSSYKPDPGMQLVREGLVYAMAPGALELRNQHVNEC